MNEMIKSISLLPLNFMETDENSIANIYDNSCNFCGYFKTKDKRTVLVFDSLGRFSGYFISNPKGFMEKYDETGNFDGFLSDLENPVIYDKKGVYFGFYISEKGVISEYSSSGQYLGYYFENEQMKSLIKFNSLGNRQFNIDK